MKPRWLFIILILLMASCSTGGTSISPTDTEPAAPTAAPSEAQEQTIPTSTITPTSTLEETSIPAPTQTDTPVPIYTQVFVPTVPQTILPNPAAIIAKVESGKDWIFFLVGGSQNGDWISAGAVGPIFEEDTNFQLHWAFENMTWISGRYIVHEHICDQYYVNTEPFSISESAVGVAGDWPVRPRTVIEIPTKNEIYKTALAAWLVEQAPSQPIPMISKIWRVDVDGNGTDEVFTNATRFVESTGHNVEPRDYSVVLMRTVVGNEVATVKLAGDYYSEAAANQFPLTYTLEFIGDLNGDGKMEVVVGVSRWEGNGFMVFEIDGAQAQLVLSVMCAL